MILALDGDFLSSGYPGFLLNARQFASRRDPDLKEKMSRFYSVQSTPTNTSGKADNSLPVRASEVEQIARAIAAGIGMGASGGQAAAGPQKQFVDAVVNDLKAHHGAAGRRSRATASHGVHPSTCAGSCHEPGARCGGQHRGLHRPDRSQTDGSARRTERAGQRDECRQRRLADDYRRQSGLRRSPRPAARPRP